MTVLKVQKLMRSDLDDMVLEYCKLFGLPEKVVYFKQGNKECADIYYNTKIQEVPSEIHRANDIINLMKTDENLFVLGMHDKEAIIRMFIDREIKPIVDKYKVKK